MFDIPPHQACRVLTTDALDADTDFESDEMLIEASLDVSTLLAAGQERKVGQILLVVEDPSRELLVADFSPRTELTSRYASNITRSEKRERQNSAGINASVIPMDSVSLQGNANHGTSRSNTIGYETLPPKELLSASGTMKRGSAVYFKFNATPQTTLEGRRELKIAYRVPYSWRGGYVYLRCAAYSSDSTQGRRKLVGGGDFLVTLYLAGDQEARARAVEMAKAERHLRRLAPGARARVEKKESFATRFTSVFKPTPEKKPVVPDQWLNQVLVSHWKTRDFDFDDDLPNNVQAALQDFTMVRQELLSLNTSPTIASPNEVSTNAEPRMRWRPRADAATNSL